MLSQWEEGLKILEAAVTGEWFLPPIPPILFCILWPLTFASFMFRAENEERSPKERAAEVGRCLPCCRIRASQHQRIDGMEHTGASRFFGEE
jgi:hypothetical protein